MRSIALFIIALVIWCILNWYPSQEELITGIVIALLVAAVFRNIFYLKSTAFLHPRRMFFFLFVFIPVFIYHCFKANVNMACRILHPAMPINPGIVKAKTHLQSSIARALLVNAITLTPGTLAIDLIGEDLYIHWIDVKSKDVDEVTRLIVEPFEKWLKEAFE